MTALRRHVTHTFASGKFSRGSLSCDSLSCWTLWNFFRVRKKGAAQRAAEKQEAHSTRVKWRLGSASPNDTLQSLFWPRFYKVLQQNKVPCSRLLASGNRCCGLVSRQAGGPRSFILQYVPFSFHLFPFVDMLTGRTPIFNIYTMRLKQF